ncbi:Mitochondrial intermediate peptidase, mitochondrial-like protein [Drosera capensis]
MSPLLRRTTTAFSPISHLRLLYTSPATASDSVNQTGLYGLHHLKSAKGFQRFVDDAIERAGELVNYLGTMPSGDEIIRTMDEISDTVCSVVDSAELCRSTHPDREFIDEASKAAVRMSEYLHFLNTNHILYKAVIKAEQEGDKLSAEAKRAASYLRLDFEKGGIHLSDDKSNRVNKLNVDIAGLCQAYNENIAIDPGYVDVYPATSIPSRLHHLGEPVYRPVPGIGTREGNRQKGYRIRTNPDSLSSIMQWVPDAEVRKLIYVKGNSVPRANLDVLDKLIASRHELAQLIGFKSYAEFAILPNMAAGVEVVESFLLEMSEVVRPNADEEFEKIRNFKRKHTGQGLVDLEPWDETYFTRIMKSSIYNFQSSVVASYFPLTQCIEGLKILIESLYRTTFHRIPCAPGESWHPDVMKLMLHHSEEGDLGFLYLDLYSRKGKYTGCAHFAIKGGRRISEAEYQLPIVALVCNFSKMHGLSTARLNHWEVETLFHEFGHALHSLLSRTDYQHFSGTRVALDLAETPSNLFEYFAWDYRVLKTFAKHCSSGETIPQKLVESMQDAKKMFAATELQRQVFYAIMDQRLFGEQCSQPRDTISMVSDLRRQFTSGKHIEGISWHIRFPHLLNYGGGYYSYLYAKCFSATIWKKLFQEDPLSPDAGTALRTKFLQHGGAKDPVDILHDMVGDGIVKRCNGGMVPDVTALCEELELRPVKL